MQPTTQTIRDIELPMLAQDEHTLLIFGVIAFSLFVVYGAIVYHRSRSKRFQAVRALRRLARALQAQSINNQSCAYEVASLMQRGLNLSRIAESTFFPPSLSEHRNRWQSFVTSLDQARYAAKPFPISSLNQLLFEAEYWLKRWP